MNDYNDELPPLEDLCFAPGDLVELIGANPFANPLGRVVDIEGAKVIFQYTTPPYTTIQVYKTRLRRQR